MDAPVCLSLFYLTGIPQITFYAKAEQARGDPGAKLQGGRRKNELGRVDAGNERAAVTTKTLSESKIKSIVVDEMRRDAERRISASANVNVKKLLRDKKAFLDDVVKGLQKISANNI